MFPTRSLLLLSLVIDIEARPIIKNRESAAESSEVAEWSLDCSTIQAFGDVYSNFESYQVSHPWVNLGNVAGPAGQEYRDALEKCSYCTAPFGPEDLDISGIGVVVGFLIQGGCAMVTLAYKLMRRRRELFQKTCPLPRRPDAVVSTIFYTSLAFSTSILLSAVIWNAKNQLSVLQMSLLGHISGLCLGSLTATFPWTERFDTLSKLNFLATFPSCFLMIVLAIQLVRSQNGEFAKLIQPYYKSFGIDCPKEIMELNLKITAISPDVYHHIAMIGGVIWLVYFYAHGFYRWRISHGTNRKPFISNETICRRIFIGHTLMYIILFLAGAMGTYLIMQARKRFQEWSNGTGQHWAGNDWGFGQILAVIVWIGPFWEIFHNIVLHPLKSFERTVDDRLEEGGMELDSLVSRGTHYKWRRWRRLRQNTKILKIIVKRSDRFRERHLKRQMSRLGME